MPLGFSDAVKRWRRMSQEEKGDDIAWKLFSDAEERIMRHKPRDLLQAADMLEIVIDMTDGRDDGLDAKALRSIRTLLLEQAERQHMGAAA
ncbi:hypothetical protein D3C72_1969550 [compost metagenome]